MKKSTLLLTLASIALPTYAQTSPAPVQERDPLQNEASMPNINQKNLKEDSGFPYGWNKGDTCVMITNKTKKYLRIYGREL